MNLYANTVPVYLLSLVHRMVHELRCAKVSKCKSSSLLVVVVALWRLVLFRSCGCSVQYYSCELTLELFSSSSSSSSKEFWYEREIPISSFSLSALVNKTTKSSLAIAGWRLCLAWWWGWWCWQWLWGLWCSRMIGHFSGRQRWLIVPPSGQDEDVKCVIPMLLDMVEWVSGVYISKSTKIDFMIWFCEGLQAIMCRIASRAMQKCLCQQSWMFWRGVRRVR